ncbi:MAG: hypothetical protein GY777_30430, partial [Candidatus Brocadiaceae bacterium]|nr:hypothetical protein [Candidatus Brocadiaceae bacterium]
MTFCLKNVEWAQPIVANCSARKVHIGLYVEDDGQIQFEVYTELDNEEGTIVHSQGVAEIKKKEETPLLDVKELKTQMNERLLSAEDCYQAFKRIGIEYGVGYRGIREIYQGENHVLARLSLPSSVHDTQDEYVLHPSLMDAALQSSIGLMLENSTLSDSNETPPEPSLPFALKSLEILSSCTSEMYAWVRYSNGNTVSDKVQKLDIDLCDEQGNVCVKMRGVEYKNEALNFIEREEEKTSLVASLDPIKLSFIENKEQSFSGGCLRKPTDISLGNTLNETLEREDSSFEITGETSSIVLSNSAFDSSSRERTDPVPSSVNLYDYGKGIFLIQISETETKIETQNILSESMIQELLQALRKIQEVEEAKVLILAGTDQCFLTGGRRHQNEAIKQKLHQEIASFPFPVIAAMKGDALGVGFLVGALCDFMICSEEGEYYYTNLDKDLFPTEEEESFMIERFDEARAREFLYSTSISTGKQLQEKGWSCQILPKEQVDT